MFRLLVLGLIFVIVGLVSYWLSLNSGMLIFNIYRYEIEMPVTTAFALLILCILFFHFFFLLIYRIFALPETFKNFLYKKASAQAHEELIRFLINYSCNNLSGLEKSFERLNKNKLLSKETKKIITYLYKEESKLGLQAELIDLVENDATKEWALTKLSESLTSLDSHSNAPKYALELWHTHPSFYSARLIIKSLYLNKEWDQIINLLNTFKMENCIGSELRSGLISFVQYMKAKDLLILNDLNKAAEYAYDSFKSSNFRPGLTILIKIKLIQNDFKAAFRFIETAWEAAPSYELAKLVLSVEKNLEAEKFFELVKRITSTNRNHYESRLLLAKAALSTDRLQLALNEINEAINSSEYKVRPCLLMTELYQRSKNPIDSLNWLRKAFLAKNDTYEFEYLLDFETLKIIHAKC